MRSTFCPSPNYRSNSTISLNGMFRQLGREAKPSLVRVSRRRPPAARPCYTVLRTLSSSSSASTRPATIPTSAAAAAIPSTVHLLTDLKHLLHRYPLLKDTGWEARVERALADVQHERRARIAGAKGAPSSRQARHADFGEDLRAVIGEKDAGVSSLVTAAFDDPLSADEDASVALASRRLVDDGPEAIAVTYSDKVVVSQQELGLPINWLRANSTDLVEIAYGDPPPLRSSLDALYSSDAVVLLVSEILSLSPKNTQRLLLELSGKPNLFLVVNTSDPSHTSALQTVQHQLDSLLRSEERPTIHVISTDLAIAGLQALRPDDPNVPVSFENFQKAYVTSGIPTLKDVLARSIATINQPSSEAGVPSNLQLQTASYMVDKVLGVAAAEGSEIEYLLSSAQDAIEGLAAEGEQAQKRVLDGLGLRDGTLKAPLEQVTEARNAFEALLNGRLAWWKLPYRTDSITTELALVADTSYLRQFEDRLIFDTGRLIGLSSTMSRSTDTLFKSSAFSSTAPPLASLYSPLLLNRIDQAAVETGHISTTSLSAPVVSRRNQITSPGGPAEVLQARAQKAVVGSATLSTSAIAVGVATHLVEYAELLTSVGVGLFGTALSAWLLQRGWYKAQKKFFIDVEERVTGGVEADLAVAAQQIVDRSLFKSQTAVAGARQLLRKRQVDYNAFAKELRRIDRARPTV